MEASQQPAQTDPEGNPVIVEETSTDPGLPVEESPAPAEESATPEQVADQPPAETPGPTDGGTSEAGEPEQVSDQAPAPDAAYDPPPTPAPAQSQPQVPAHIVGGGSEAMPTGVHVTQPGSPGVDVPPPVDNSLAGSPQLPHLTTPIGGEGEGGGGSDAPTLGAPPPPEGSDVLPPAGGPIH